MKKKHFIILISALLVAAIVVIICTVSPRKNKEKVEEPVKEETDLMEAFTTQIIYVEPEITADIVKDGLNDIGKLVTAEYYFTEVITFDESLKLWDINMPFTKSSFIYGYDGTITAGIDFSNISVNLDNEKKTIEISIPKSVIISNEIDENSFEVFDEKTSIFNPITIENFNDSLIELKKNARENAISKGILEKADENAETIILNFVEGVVGKEYNISLKR